MYIVTSHNGSQPASQPDTIRSHSIFFRGFCDCMHSVWVSYTPKIKAKNSVACLCLWHWHHPINIIKIIINERYSTWVFVLLFPFGLCVAAPFSYQFPKAKEQWMVTTNTKRKTRGVEKRKKLSHLSFNQTICMKFLLLFVRVKLKLKLKHQCHFPPFDMHIQRIDSSHSNCISSFSFPFLFSFVLCCLCHPATAWWHPFPFSYTTVSLFSVIVVVVVVVVVAVVYLSRIHFTSLTQFECFGKYRFFPLLLAGWQNDWLANGTADFDEWTLYQCTNVCMYNTILI